VTECHHRLDFGWLRVLRVARAKTTLAQDQLKINGHAIEEAHLRREPGNHQTTGTPQRYETSCGSYCL
jgi:hypothetical protein